MAASSIKARTSIREGMTTVRIIIRHPMDTGFETDPESGEIIPPHYIDNVSIFHGDTLVMQCDWSRAVSRNPYLSFEFAGANPDDLLRITWHDNLGETDTAEFRIK